MNNIELISQCRYYSGERTCPWNDEDLYTFWKCEDAYVNLRKGSVNELESNYYKGIGGKDFPSIPRGILIEMFFHWSKGVYTPQDHLDEFYKLVDYYLEIASAGFPKDELPAMINGSTINQPVQSNNMKVVHWNISYISDKEKVLETLSRLVKDEDAIVCLQEVQPSVKDFLVGKLQGWGGTKGAPYAYSLDYRQPGKYDGENRKLGVLILCPASMYIIDSGVFNRTPFPDRTLWAEVLYQGEVIKVASLHSITGCGYSKTKSTQYFSFAEAIGEFAPDILTIDANEPEVDHWDITQAKFYDNKDKGEGARTFFTNLAVNHMLDIYALCFNHDDFELGKPLTPSVKVNRKGYCRYDFIFVSDPKFDFCNCEYLYQAGLDGTSDHAVVVAELELTSRQTRDRGNEDVLEDKCMFPYNSLQEKHLIKYCRYYGHDYTGKSGLIAEYEHHWIEDVINNKCDLSDYVNGRDLNWLQTFNIEDGVPLGLKAILFNRYFHWSSYETVDDFKRWYLETYLTGKYGE